MSLAQKINTWLTPARRQALYVIITTIGAIVAASTPIQSAQIAIWLQLLVAVGVVGSLILGSIVTRSVAWTSVYRVLGIFVAALTAAGWLSGAHAGLVMQVLTQFGTIVPMLAVLLRTDTSTADGTPAIEVPAPALSVLVDPPVPADPPFTMVVNGVTTFNPGGGALPTKTL